MRTKTAFDERTKIRVGDICGRGGRFQRGRCLRRVKKDSSPGSWKKQEKTGRSTKPTFLYENPTKSLIVVSIEINFPPDFLGNVGASFVKSCRIFSLDQMEDEVTKIQFVGRSDLEAALSLNHPQKSAATAACSLARTLVIFFVSFQG